MMLRDVIQAVSARPGFVEHRAATLSLAEPRPWYVASAVAITIWVGAVSLGSFLVAIRVFNSGAAQLVGALTLLGIGAVCSRAASGLARLHVSLIAYAGSTALLMVFLDDSVELSKAGTLFGVACVQVLCFALIAARPVRFKATFGGLLALWGVALEHGGFADIDVLLVGAAVALSALWLCEARLSATRAGRAVRPAGFALAAGLLWLSTFSLTTWEDARPSVPLATAVALAGVLFVVTMRAAREASAERGSGAVRLALVGVVALAALAAQSPAILTAVLVIALGRMRKEPVLEGLGVVGLIGFAVWLYYGMHVSLLWTSAALVVAGVSVIAARAWLLRGGQAPTAPVGASVLSPQPRTRPADRRLRLALPTLAVVAVLLGLIVHKEGILRTGTTALLELAPRDPRSLLQGDYVALAYRDSANVLAATGWDERRDRVVVFQLGADGIARFVRLEDASALAHDELLLRALRTNTGYAFGADSYFFSEGAGDTWERARYAEVKVGHDGTAVLVGLRDEGRALLR
ncbi:MAG: GDYXXLXY domain-containing protein [Deltaproteobacteria bacterium]|nr:GDYXXLXY domain-containing protein [Deltaproteobacteria bacterium]